MCMMLYLATAGDVPVLSSPALRVEHVEPSRDAVCRWFSLPTVRFVGAHTGCSCGFPSVIAEEPIEYFAGMSLASDDRDADLRSVRSLLALLRGHVAADGRVELYPIADGDEDKAPKGTIELRLDALSPDTFFFNERFMHRVTR